MKTSREDLLDRLLSPIGASLNDEAARKLVALKADRSVQRRVEQLARKCNDGKLTADEREEYETYVLAGDFVAILQAQARLRLAQGKHPA